MQKLPYSVQPGKDKWVFTGPDIQFELDRNEIYDTLSPVIIRLLNMAYLQGKLDNLQHLSTKLEDKMMVDRAIEEVSDGSH